MCRFATSLAALAVLLLPLSAAAQVVHTDPGSPRTDQSVTIYFNADQGTGGLEGHTGDVYAHTGISTDQNADQAWKCVKNHWPTSTDFTGNRSDTKLTKVGTDRYELVISDIRAYYQDTSTSCSLGSDEKVQTMNFVFRSADGSKEGKAEGGGDIFVKDVVDVSGGDPVVAAQITEPASDPLYPYIASTDETVTISASVETASVRQFRTLNLYVNGTQVASGGYGGTSVQHNLALDSPGRYDVEVRANARATNGSTIRDTATTTLYRTPNVTNQARPPGVEDGINHQNGSTVTFSLNAPNKDYVYLLGDFNDWQVDKDYFMKKDGDHWWITVDGLQSGEQYAFQYLVDGEIRVADPFSRQVLTPVDEYISDQTYPNLKPYPASETENIVSLMETGTSDFTFSSFTPPPQDEMVVYELLLRDFLEQSDYQTLTDTLDYLDRLGVNAIELMPVAEYGGNNSWGYNPSFHFALDKAYGSPQQFKQFVEAAHNRGIAVILDVVYNHVTNQSPLYQLYGSAADSPFLDGNASGICGGFFQKLNHGSSFVENYIDRANAYWIEEYNVDGFRYDLAKCLGGEGGVKRMADHVWDNVDRDTYMILEYFGSTDTEQRLANYRDGEAGIEGMIPWHKLSPQYGEAGMGYMNNGGTSSNIRGSYFGFAGFNDPSLMAYMESHDEQWLMHKFASFGNANAEGIYNIKDLDTALNRQKLVGAFFFTVPGPRMTWQFAELGYGYQPDECLQDDGGASNCPSSAPGRTGEKPIRWEYRDPEQSPNRVRLYKTWQALLRLRNQNEVFRAERGVSNSAESITMQASDTDYIRWIKLEDENMDAVIVGNFDVIRRSASVEFPQTGTWYNFFEDTERQVNSTTQSFDLRPGEFRIYTSKEQPAPPMGLVPSAPIHEASASVSSNGRVDFGATGVDVAFSGVSNSGTVTVERVNEAPYGTSGISEGNVSAYRFVIEKTGALSFTDQTEVRFDLDEIAGIDGANANNVVVYSRPTEDTGTFAARPTSYDAGANELVAETGSFSEFVLASNTESLPIPVELAGFDGAVTGERTVQLSWQTASETNNAGFQVQRQAGAADGAPKAAGSGWTDLEFVDGAGTTSEPQRYRLTDEVPFAADSVHYRLKQVDTDGTAHYTTPVTLAMGTPDQLTLRTPFPNPVRSQATIRYAVPERQDVSLVLFDVMGRRVRTLTQSSQTGRHERRLDVSGLSSGLYLLRLRAGSSVQTRRVTVVK